MHKSEQSAEDAWAIFEEAAQYDATLKVDRSDIPKLLRRNIPATQYSRKVLFGEMLSGRPCLLSGSPRPLRNPLQNLSHDDIGAALATWLVARKNREGHRVYSGPTGAPRYMTLKDLGLKWRADRTLFGVTDLHIRDTEMESVIDPDVISGFNILRKSSADAKDQEMFSFVISSRGYVTDSHSDDPDSTNYCCSGKKLWLAWDTYEGRKVGLQDVERGPIERRAQFNTKAWLSVPSARWFLVEPGQTLSLPGHLTHKVVTIEKYIGVGGFFVALPNCIRLLAHWIIRGPLWSIRDSTGYRDDLIEEIALSVRDVILSTRRASMAERRNLGYDYLGQSAKFFIKACPKSQFRLLWSDPRFRCVANVVSAPWPAP